MEKERKGIRNSKRIEIEVEIDKKYKRKKRKDLKNEKMNLKNI